MAHDAPAPGPPAVPDAPASRASLSPSTSALAAFAILAAVDAAFIADGGRVRTSLRLWHHLFDLGHVMLMGSLVALAIRAWSTLRTRSGWLRSRRFAGEAAVAVMGIAAAYVLAREDFAGFAAAAAGHAAGPAAAAGDAGGGVAGSMLLAVLLLGVGLSPAAALVAARRAVALHPLASLGVGVAGLAAAIGNGLVLQADYFGVHFFLGIDAAVVLLVAISSAPIPARLRRPRPARRAPIVPLVIFAASVPSLVVRPDNAVRTQLMRVDSAILVPVLARFAWSRDVAAVPKDVPAALRPWMVDRRHGRPIPPSGESLLPRAPIVLLLGIDSLRADLFEKADGKARMPNLLALQRRSIAFRDARSPGARTITTWSQVFAGRYVTGLRWRGEGNRLSIADDPAPRFSDLLREAGVHTTTFVSYSALGRRGLARGFDEVVDVPPSEGQDFALSADVVPRLIASLSEPHDGPRFLFAHFMDAHFPYDAGARKGSTRARFLSEVALADASIGRIWRALEERALLDRTVLVVTADHGEGLGEHGTPHHTVNLYEELIRVPLFVRIPGVAPRDVDEPVSLMDLGPTFLDLFSLDTPPSFLGQSLLPFARGASPELTRPIAAERHGTRAMLFDRRKVIVDVSRGRDEIYDLVDDPAEARNLADDLGEEGKELVATTRAFFEAHAIGP